MMHLNYAEQSFPLVFAGPKESKGYFGQIDRFIGATLGEEARIYYKIIIDHPEKIAECIQSGIKKVREYRRKLEDAFYYNWMLHVEHDYQWMFTPTHTVMSALNLHYAKPKHELVFNLRIMFSGIVSGNIKEEVVLPIKKNGPFQISVDQELMQQLDKLLSSFCSQRRMKLSRESEYKPCYEIGT